MKLSAKMDRTADAVQRLQDENFRMKGQVARMEEEMFRAEAKKWEGAGSVLIFKEGLEADSVRKLADAVMNTCEGCCAVFSRNEDGSYKYAMGEIDGDLRQYTKEMNAASCRQICRKGKSIPGWLRSMRKAASACFWLTAE